MDQKQLEALTRRDGPVSTRIFLSASDYYEAEENSGPRTLLYGYTCDRDTHHVFQDHKGDIHIYVYRSNQGSPETSIRRIDVSADGIETLDELIPNKRLYPQYCDYDFCVYLKKRGVSLPFTQWEKPRADPDHPDRIFHGEIY